jgi:hypothetical protein
MESETIYNVRLAHNTSFIVAGPSGSGKTQWVIQLIRNRQHMFDEEPQRLVWCQGIEDFEQERQVREVWNDNVVFCNGFTQQLEDFRPHDMVVVDDLQGELTKSTDFTALFTKLAHHKPLVCIYLCQNLFHKSDGEARSRSLSAGYICLMRNVRDKTSVLSLGRQMFPGRAQVLTKIYEDATRGAFSYLLIDLRQQTPENLRFRTNIFPNDPQPQTVYIPV